MPIEKQDAPATTLSDIADIHDLYQKSVQSPDNDMPMLSDYFKEYTGKPLRQFREDFCGTAYLSAYFVTQHAKNQALGVDLDWPTLNWGMKHNLSPLTPDQQTRISLVNENVLDVQQPRMQMIAALNFSYMVFHDRPTLLQYLTNAKESLPAWRSTRDGYLGREAKVRCFRKNRGKLKIRKTKTLGISFSHGIKTHSIPSRIYIPPAFIFLFRIAVKSAMLLSTIGGSGTIPEVTELMAEAGFKDIHVLWEGTDPDTKEGTQTYHRTEKGDADLAWIAYIVGKNSH